MSGRKEKKVTKLFLLYEIDSFFSLFFVCRTVEKEGVEGTIEGMGEAGTGTGDVTIRSPNYLGMPSVNSKQ